METTCGVSHLCLTPGSLKQENCQGLKDNWFVAGLSYRAGCCPERDLEEGKEEGKREKGREGGRGGTDKIFMYNSCNKLINAIDG